MRTSIFFVLILAFLVVTPALGVKQIGDMEIKGNLTVDYLIGTLSGTASRVPIGSFIDTSYGLKNSTANKIQVNLTTNDGLEFGSGAAAGSLGVKTGNGLTTSASGVLVNLTANKGLEIGTGAAAGALQAKAGNGVELGASGIAVKAEDTSIVVGTGGAKVGTGFEMDVISGGAAGNLTLTGVKVGDELIGVAYFTKAAGNLTTVTDLSAEFTILDTNVIENAGHTVTSGGYLLVNWLDRTA